MHFVSWHFLLFRENKLYLVEMASLSPALPLFSIYSHPHPSHGTSSSGEKCLLRPFTVKFDISLFGSVWYKKTHLLLSLFAKYILRVNFDLSSRSCSALAWIPPNPFHLFFLQLKRQDTLSLQVSLRVRCCMSLYPDDLEARVYTTPPTWATTPVCMCLPTVRY